MIMMIVIIIIINEDFIPVPYKHICVALFNGKICSLILWPFSLMIQALIIWKKWLYHHYMISFIVIKTNVTFTFFPWYNGLWNRFIDFSRSKKIRQEYFNKKCAFCDQSAILWSKKIPWRFYFCKKSWSSVSLSLSLF